jgi:hypothetical protein
MVSNFSSYTNTYLLSLLAAKFSGDNLDEQQCRVAELKLAMVLDDKISLIILIFLSIGMAKV